MTDNQTTGMSAQERLDQIMASARALGVEMDEEEAIQWLTAVAAESASSQDVSFNVKSGVFGHRVALLDFDPADLERLRRVAAIVEIEDRPGVETAIALSGSSAQSHVQTFPGDFDYFERVNIQAGSHDEACTVLGDVIRDKALTAARGTGYQLIEVRFGTFKQSVVRGEKTLDVGASITWSPAEIEDGHFDVFTPDGEVTRIDWAYACQEPGWCKLDWVLVDPAEPRAVKASNMLDATWEAPDGNIKPLDGFIDPYYQEVYLDAESIPVFSKVVQHMDAEALQKYVSDLEKEVKKYTGQKGANYGKAAKRMYNVFRLTGRFEEAAFVRELFDEPAALLYQVGALLDGLARTHHVADSIARRRDRAQRHRRGVGRHAPRDARQHRPTRQPLLHGPPARHPPGPRLSGFPVVNGRLMSDTHKPERYFSIDVEANGPLPGEYSMSSLGCAGVGLPEHTFYVELTPITDNVLPAAEAISGLTLDHLKAEGTDPAAAMQKFHDWVAEIVGDTHRPVFVAFNATFDWQFVNWYFLTFVGDNPFGVSGLDIKAYAMGLMDVTWGDTSSDHLYERFQIKQAIIHHALHDALAQAELFEKLLAHNSQRSAT
jgi:DNA polymerase III epsilon subunit-like protein